MRRVVAGLVGLVATLLLFPFGGVVQCSDGIEGGTCTSWSESILVRYSGGNGAVGMGIALTVGVVIALFVYFLSQRLARRRRASHSDEQQL
jgi:ABC-type uncharacterized transport system permease subunit